MINVMVVVKYGGWFIDNVVYIVVIIVILNVVFSVEVILIIFDVVFVFLVGILDIVVDSVGVVKNFNFRFIKIKLIYVII